MPDLVNQLLLTLFLMFGYLWLLGKYRYDHRLPYTTPAEDEDRLQAAVDAVLAELDVIAPKANGDRWEHNIRGIVPLERAEVYAAKMRGAIPITSFNDKVAALDDVIADIREARAYRKRSTWQRFKQVIKELA